MKNQKGLAPVFIIILIAMILGGGYMVYQNSKAQNIQPPGQIACTQDAKLCPDGSYVSRSGPNCEFAPCPTSKESTQSADMTTWKTYKSTRWGYTFMYPQEWRYVSDSINEAQGLLELQYTESGKKYIFSVGAGEREGPPADKITDKTVHLWGNPQTFRTWYQKDKPFFIVVMPYGVKTGGNIEITLPDQNTDFYEELFNQILSTFKFLP